MTVSQTSATPAPPPTKVRPSATSPLRLVGYAVVLVAAAFSQQGGRMVADTKFDLLTDPGRFLGQGVRLWDPVGAFGQLQNQAYGYAWPMGPFFWLGHLVRFPEWAVQRAWWSLLLCVAFFGILRLAQALRIGTPVTQVVAAFAFVLTPRFTSVLGAVSIEVWPMAVAPWVLLPLVKGSQQGSVRRAAALSALAVLCCGGVNAVAVAAVLPLGVIWILTRAPGPRRWRLFAWWTSLTVLATAWWWGPLLVLGRYSVPFLDYIENARITTVPTSQVKTLLGISDWVAYVGGQDYPAGSSFLNKPFLLVDAATVVAIGLMGIALRRAPHQRFLVLGVLVGTALVGFGFTGQLDGFFALDRQQALDGALAPLRNVHKFDVVLRIPLVLGMAHALSRLPRLFEGSQGLLLRRTLSGTVALVLLGLTSPWLADDIGPRGGVLEVPAYWPEVADYLRQQSPSGTALVLPASAFGVYVWGNVHDDILQGFARSPWATRNVIPLAQPGNVVMLDAITRAIESGHPDPAVARYLAANGISQVVVRNDLDRLKTGAPDPVLVHSLLTATPGLTLTRTFGPSNTQQQWSMSEDGRTRLVFNSGASTPLHAVDVYRVADPAGATWSQGMPGLVGDPGSAISPALDGRPAGAYLLGPDGHGRDSGQVLTDGNRRRESNFAEVRRNESATMGADDGYRVRAPEPTRRVFDDQARWESTQTWSGDVRTTSASSSQAYADALAPLRLDAAPSAALDGDPQTAWRSARNEPPDGQWWQADFTAPRRLSVVTVRLAADSAVVPRLKISAGRVVRTVSAPVPGEAATWVLDLPQTRSLRVQADGLGFGVFAVSEVSADDVTAQRSVRLPAPVPDVPVDRVALTRDPDQLACADVESVYACSPLLRQSGDDGDTLARTFSLSSPDTYRLTATASLRRGPSVGAAVQRLLGVTVTTPGQAPRGDVAASPLAMVDNDGSTTWISQTTRPTVRVRLAEPVELRSLTLRVNDGAPAAAPTEVMVRSGGRSRTLDVGSTGRIELPGWQTRDFTVTFLGRTEVLDVQGPDLRQVMPGLSEISVNDATPSSVRSGRINRPCGTGPTITIGGVAVPTAPHARLVDLVHGRRVPLDICAPAAISLGTSPTDLLALPTAGMRVDAVRLDRVGALTAPVRPVPVTRGAGSIPQSVQLGDRPTAGVLTLPQNLNAGWRASVAGKALVPVRVDGWKQGWMVPSGQPVDVRLDFTPTTAFTTWLVVGFDGALLVVLLALPLGFGGRRSPGRFAALRPGRAGVLDVAVVGGVAGWLGGWAGIAVVGVVALLVLTGLARRASPLWGPLAALAALAAGLSLTSGAIKDSGYAGTWGQVWCLVALGALAAAVSTTRGRVVRRRAPTS